MALMITTTEPMKQAVLRKRSQKKYNVPVIGHFADRSIRFHSILEAEKVTGISYTLIFEACVGKIHKARNVYWEFEKGNHYIKYKAHYLRMMEQQAEISHGSTDKKKH
jgi:hypothetical protein